MNGENLEITPEVEVIESTQAEVVSTPTTFELIVEQRFTNKKQEDVHNHYALKFELDGESSGKIDFIIGTALDRLFSKMALAKSMKTKLFTSTQPLNVTIKSTHFVLNLGKIDETFLQKIKVNSSVASKLAFVDRVVAVTADILRPMTVKATSNVVDGLRQHLISVGKKPQELNESAFGELSRMVIANDGEL